MVKLTFISSSGQQNTVEAEEGLSVMKAAVANKVPEIEAACGGSQVCGTCHAYIDEPWFDQLPKPNEIEVEMLEYGVLVKPNSRLCCQIPVTKALEGMVIHTPVTQR